MTQIYMYHVDGWVPLTDGKTEHDMQAKEWWVIATTPELAGMQVRLCNDGCRIDDISLVQRIDYFHQFEELSKERKRK